jgi:hypothetical protein
MLTLLIVASIAVAFPMFASNPSNAARASTPTPAVLQSGPLVLTDTLKDNSHGQRWEESNDSFGGCNFLADGYHATQTFTGYFTTCTAKGVSFSDFIYQAQVTIVKGNTGGLIFRVQDTPGRCYAFQVSRDGSYALILYVDNTRTAAHTLSQGTSLAIHTQLNESNILKVAAHGNTFDLFINGQSVGQAQDRASTYRDGHIGLVADAQTASPVDVILAQVNVWTL